MFKYPKLYLFSACYQFFATVYALSYALEKPDAAVRSIEEVTHIHFYTLAGFVMTFMSVSALGIAYNYKVIPQAYWDKLNFSLSMFYAPFLACLSSIAWYYHIAMSGILEEMRWGYVIGILSAGVIFLLGRLTMYWFLINVRNATRAWEENKEKKNKKWW